MSRRRAAVLLADELARSELERDYGELPAIERPLLLRVGDTLVLHSDPKPGARAEEAADGVILEPAHIACQQPEVFQYLSPGDPVSLNDGKISGVIIGVDDEQV